MAEAIENEFAKQDNIEKNEGPMHTQRADRKFEASSVISRPRGAQARASVSWTTY